MPVATVAADPLAVEPHWSIRTPMSDDDEKPMPLSREDLYELVWSKPMRELAKDFNISDVALAKRCRGLGIPVTRPRLLGAARRRPGAASPQVAAARTRVARRQSTHGRPSTGHVSDLAIPRRLATRG
jgi:hypothetical protein